MTMMYCAVGAVGIAALIGMIVAVYLLKVSRVRSITGKAPKSAFGDAERLENDRCSIALSRTVREKREKCLHAG